MSPRDFPKPPGAPASAPDARLHGSHWLLFETAPHGIVIHDAKGAIIDANLAAERMLGMTLDMVKGQVELDHLWQVIHEDGSSFPLVDQPPHVALRTGEPNGPVVLGVHVHGRPAPLWISVSSIPMRLPNQPRPFASLTMFVDVTEQRVAADALRASEARFKTAFRDSPVMMAISDFGTGKFVDVNDRYCEVTGYSRDELLGQRSIELGIVEAPTRDLLIAAMRDRGRVSNFEIPIRTKSGDDLRVMMAGDVLELNGAPHLLTIATDVTARTRMDDERVRLAAHLRFLQRSERISQRAASVVRDVGSVLSSILTAAERQLPGARDDATLRSALSAIARDGRQGLEVLRGLRDIISASVGPATAFDLNGLVRDELEVLSLTVLRKMRLLTEYAPSALVIRGDREALGHALLTLCLNAVDTMDADGVLTLQTKHGNDGSAVLVVADQRSSDVKNAEPAAEAEYLTLPDEASEAFGLTLVRETIEALGGAWAIERAVGRGGRVVIRLPLAAAESPRVEVKE